MSKIPFSFTIIPDYFEKNGYFTPKKDKSHFKMAIFLMWSFSKCKSYSTKIVFDGKEIDLQPFEFICGRNACSKETGLSPKEIRTIISNLKENSILLTTANSSANRFTCYKWAKECFSQVKGQLKGQPKTKNNIKGQLIGQLSKNFKHRVENVNFDVENREERANSSATSEERYSESLFSQEKESEAKKKSSCRQDESQDSQDSLLSKMKMNLGNSRTTERPFKTQHNMYYQDCVDILLAIISNNNLTIRNKTIEIWMSKWEHERISDNLILLAERKKNINHHEKWMERALKENFAEQRKNIATNRLFVENFKRENSWKELSITANYARDEETGNDYQFKLNPSLFSEMIVRKYESKI